MWKTHLDSDQISYKSLKIKQVYGKSFAILELYTSHRWELSDCPNTTGRYQQVFFPPLWIKAKGFTNLKHFCDPTPGILITPSVKWSGLPMFSQKMGSTTTLYLYSRLFPKKSQIYDWLILLFSWGNGSCPDICFLCFILFLWVFLVYLFCTLFLFLQLWKIIVLTKLRPQGKTDQAKTKDSSTEILSALSTPALNFSRLQQKACAWLVLLGEMSEKIPPARIII